MFRLYDIVSRMGQDEQIVTKIYDGGDLMDFVCIKAGGCFRIGDKEFNIPRRYEFVRKGRPSDVPIIEDAVTEGVEP